MKTVQECPRENLREFFFKHGGIESVFRSGHQGHTEGNLFREQFVDMLDRFGYLGDSLQDFLDIDADCDGKISMHEIREHLRLLDTMATTLRDTTAAASTACSTDGESQSVRMEMQDMRIQIQRISEDQQLQYKTLLDVVTSKLNHFSMASIVQNAVDLAVTTHITKRMKEASAAMPVKVAENLERQAQDVEELRSKLDSMICTMIPDKEMLECIRRQANDLEAIRVELDKRLSNSEIEESMARQSLVVESLRTHLDKRVSNLERCFCDISGNRGNATPTRPTLAVECKTVAMPGGSVRAPLGGAGGGSCRAPVGEDAKTISTRPAGCSVQLDAGGQRCTRSGAQSPPPMPSEFNQSAAGGGVSSKSFESSHTLQQDWSVQFVHDHRSIANEKKQDWSQLLADHMNETQDSNISGLSDTMARRQGTSPIRRDYTPPVHVGASSVTASGASSREQSRSSTARQHLQVGVSGTGSRRGDASPPVIRLSSVGYRQAAAAAPARTTVAIGSPKLSARLT